MKVELTYYSELGFEGEVERTGVSVVLGDDKNIDFKTKGDTSLKLRSCGLNLSCLKEALGEFNDFDIEDGVVIMVNGILADNDVDVQE